MKIKLISEEVPYLRKTKITIFELEDGKKITVQELSEIDYDHSDYEINVQDKDKLSDEEYDAVIDAL
jgi:hypothetical protein